MWRYEKNKPFHLLPLFSQAAWRRKQSKSVSWVPDRDFVAVGIEAKQVVELLARIQMTVEGFWAKGRGDLRRRWGDTR